MRLAPLALLAVAFSSAGCFGGAGDGSGSGGTTTVADTPRPEEDDSGVFHVQFDAQGEATLEIPFPTLDTCRTPEHWMGGNLTTNGQAVVREATDGRAGPVLALTGAGSVAWSSQIVLGDVCNTLGYDPWTTDPDPEGEAVEARVTAGSVTAASAVVRIARSNCLDAVFYEGQPVGAWTALAGRGGPEPC